MQSTQLSIKDAADRLGVSQDTVRRRIKAGELHATREQTASGFRYLVKLDEEQGDGERGAHGGQDSTTTPVDESLAVEVLRDQVANLQDQVNRLTELLAREQQTVQTLLATRALPATVSSEPKPTHAESAVPTAQAAPQQAPHGRLARLRKWVGGD